ncbi:hypothetical protein C1H46_013372 [Malus baccata]|uniref:Yippee domain-containing protein n=1 Tax=Malus baccata TaxID=106549 RepID=A0A540MQN2_MALBA|nr:hypothetical protein C1H46_013372 [Malus baccata]
MGRIFLIELDGRTYRCRFCDSALALADDVLSWKKGFRSWGFRSCISELGFSGPAWTGLYVGIVFLDWELGLGRSLEDMWYFLVKKLCEVRMDTCKRATLRMVGVGKKTEEPINCTEPIKGTATAAESRSKSVAFAFESYQWVNITLGPEEDRLMYSGLHTVKDIFCCCCGQILGWKYVIAHEKNQKYKEGKFVLERWRIVEDVAEEFNLDARLGSSDGENP